MYATAVQELIDELGRLPGVGPKSAQRIAFHLLKLTPEDALRLARAITVVKERVSWCTRCFNIAESADDAAVGFGRPTRSEPAWAAPTVGLVDGRSGDGGLFGYSDRAGGFGTDGFASAGLSSAGLGETGGAGSDGLASGEVGEVGDEGGAEGRTTPAGSPPLECGICRDSRRDPTVVCVVEEPRDVVAVEKTREFRGRYHVLQGAISPIDGIGPEQLRIRELLARLEPEGITELILCTNPNIEGDATALYLASLLKVLPVKVTRIASGLPVGGDLEYADELTLGRALEGRRELGG
jgi:recombinational DNA repair protein RecR